MRGGCGVSRFRAPSGSDAGRVPRRRVAAVQGRAGGGDPQAVRVGGRPEWDHAVGRVEQYRTAQHITDPYWPTGPEPSWLDNSHQSWADATRTLTDTVAYLDHAHHHDPQHVGRPPLAHQRAHALDLDLGIDL